ncbi:MAG: hypothetical protein ACC742_15150, partial [Thermoanaerobaculales bacterium]
APLAGRTPSHRDLIDFFAPMRAETARMLISGDAPWLNQANGCGEAWFANPETGVLYPPAWLHLVLPGEWAMATEIALHLTWLSLGVGLLAGGLGVGRGGRLVAEVAAWSAGPILTTVGVLNNLETLAWLPWMVLAARLEDRRSVPLLAVTTAMAWLGGEPQIWALGVALAVGTARRRSRAVFGLSLGAGVVMVQLIPFIFWVVEGDRGPTAAAWALRGALSPGEWGGVLVPGLASAPGKMIYAESLFLGAPLLLCALLGGRRHRRVSAAAIVLFVIASLPEVGAGGLFLRLTGGLVRYPSRFALVGLALMLPLIGSGAEAWMAGQGRRLGAIVALFTLFLCTLSSEPWRWWTAGAPAALLLVSVAVPSWRRVRVGVLVAGLAATVAAGLPLLDLQPVRSLKPVAPLWPEARQGGRIYTPAPAADVMAWLASGLKPRRLWPIGYLNLEDATTLAPTFSPVVNGRLAFHLAITDEGPERRWWLDALAARWVILAVGGGLPEGMEEVRRQAGLRLLRNLTALPEVSLAASPPNPIEGWRGVGGTTAVERSPNRVDVATTATGPGSLWLSVAPVRGWRWRLDGRFVDLAQGPGIVQYLDIPAGRHRLEGRYRPPALIPAAVVSGGALSVLLAALAAGRGRMRRGVLGGSAWRG